MPRYLALVSFTDQGMRAIEKSPDRAGAFAASAESVGAKIEHLYWASGEFDGAVVINSPDEQTVSSLLLALNRMGNVRTRTLRLYDADEFRGVVAKMPS